MKKKDNFVTAAEIASLAFTMGQGKLSAEAARALGQSVRQLFDEREPRGRLLREDWETIYACLVKQCPKSKLRKKIQSLLGIVDPPRNGE
jgi:hypothetical protein